MIHITQLPMSWIKVRKLSPDLLQVEIPLFHPASKSRIVVSQKRSLDFRSTYFSDVDVVPIIGNTPGGSIVGIALSGSIVGITPGTLHCLLPCFPLCFMSFNIFFLGPPALEKRSVRDMAANFAKLDSDIGTA